MRNVTKAFAARLAGMSVIGPGDESIGTVSDVVVTVPSGSIPPRVLGLVVQMTDRRRIFVPMLRVTSIDPTSVMLASGSVSLHRFAAREQEWQVLAELVDSVVKVRPSAVLAGAVSHSQGDKSFTIVDVEIELQKNRDWRISQVALREKRSRLSRRGQVFTIDYDHIVRPHSPHSSSSRTGTEQMIARFAHMRPADAANEMQELSASQRIEVASAFDDELLADVLQELPDKYQQQIMQDIEHDRAADVLEVMDPDDAADFLGDLPSAQAESLLELMTPEDSAPVRRLLAFDSNTAGGLMTPEPVIVDPQTSVAEALARVGNPDLPVALASMVFVVRPPTATPTGKYVGCVHLQALLRVPPSSMVASIVDSELSAVHPDTSLDDMVRFFATYNLVCGPVVDSEGRLLGAVTVDDLLDHSLPDGWREESDQHVVMGLA